MRWPAAGLASLLWLASAPSQAQLKGENLLVAPPPGFKVGFKDSRNGMNMLEWIPASETVQDWTEMVTVQIFVKRADLDPGQFLRQLQTQWLAACKGSQPASISPTVVNGYAAASMTLSCPLLASTGKPENDVVPCRQRQRQLLSRPACRPSSGRAGIDGTAAEVSVRRQRLRGGFPGASLSRPEADRPVRPWRSSG
jgi:hypothetical protein